MRRLVVLLLVLVGLLVVADRVALLAAERDVGRRIQADNHLRTQPHVSIHGFPFLTQLVSGTYDDVDVTVRDLHAGRLRVARLTVRLHGAHVSLGDVVHQRVSRVPVDSASATVVLTWGDLAGALGGQLGALAGRTLGPRVVRSASVDPPHGVVLHTVVGVDLEVELSGLPFGVRLTSAQTTADGVSVTGSADQLVLRR